MENGDCAPDNQNHHHHRSDGHDLQGLAAGLVDALGILPPEEDNHDNRHTGRKVIVGELQWVVHILPNILDEARKVLSGGDGADRAGKDVVEK